MKSPLREAEPQAGPDGGKQWGSPADPAFPARRCRVDRRTARGHHTGHGGVPGLETDAGVGGHGGGSPRRGGSRNTNGRLLGVVAKHEAAAPTRPGSSSSRGRNGPRRLNGTPRRAVAGPEPPSSHQPRGENVWPSEAFRGGTEGPPRGAAVTECHRPGGVGVELKQQKCIPPSLGAASLRSGCSHGGVLLSSPPGS